MWLRDWEKTIRRNNYIRAVKGNGPSVVVNAGYHLDLPGPKNPDRTRPSLLRGLTARKDLLDLL